MHVVLKGCRCGIENGVCTHLSLRNVAVWSLWMLWSFKDKCQVHTCSPTTFSPSSSSIRHSNFPLARAHFVEARDDAWSWQSYIYSRQEFEAPRANDHRETMLSRRQLSGASAP